MNKKYISIAIIFVVLIAALFIFIDYLSYKTISFNISDPSISITIYSQKDKKIADLNKSGSIKLKDGSYYYICNSEKYTQDHQLFNISGNTQITVDPVYSTSELVNMLIPETENIHKVLNNKYGSIINDYVIGDEQLYNKGEWYSSKLLTKVSGGNMPDIYRMIMHKINNSWVIVVSPRFVIDYGSFNSVPKNVIDSVNQPASTAAYSLLY